MRRILVESARPRSSHHTSARAGSSTHRSWLSWFRMSWLIRSTRPHRRCWSVKAPVRIHSSAPATGTTEHWSRARTRLVARLESGHTLSRNHPEYWVNCNVPWFTLADVWQLRDGSQKYVQETKEFVSEIGLANSSARLLPKNTVILSRTASVGFSAIMAVPMATTQDFVNWVCGPRIVPTFLLWVFRGMKQEFDRLMMGSTHKTIYMPDAEQFSTPLPPHPEQQAIAEFLDRKTAQIDAVNRCLIQQIAKLKVYRQTLISAAVTGKINVTKEAAHD